MPDVVSPETRSRMMSGIRGRDTRPEVALRRALFAKGFRYRLHPKELPGRPDVVLRKHNAAIFIHGCFWHGHDCALFRLPDTRREFWRQKFEGNRDRDIRVRSELEMLGWRWCEVWECSLRGAGRLGLNAVADAVAHWLIGSESTLVIRGRGHAGSGPCGMAD